MTNDTYRAGTSDRKLDHLEMTHLAQADQAVRDLRFNYEPVLAAPLEQVDLSSSFLDKRLNAPLWISSMTGGTSKAGRINKLLARAAGEFGLGMGLGSCRVLLENQTYLSDFNLRPIIGEEYPLLANIGIAQVEKMLKSNSLNRLNRLVEKLTCDGLIVHINPLQEYFQPEGDRLEKSIEETIVDLLNELKTPLVIKEVGQGFGPRSLETLLRLPLAALEFGAFGGTNFSKLEILRGGQYQSLMGMAKIGHTAEEMIEYINSLIKNQKDRIQCQQFIISGGLRDYLDGYYFCERLKAPALYAQASGLLSHSQESYEQLKHYIHGQLEGLKLAKCYLTIRETARIENESNTEFVH